MGVLFGVDRREVKGNRTRHDFRAPLRGALRSLIDTLYPPTCLTCDAAVTEVGGLCPTCWRDTPFITGLVCEQCGAGQPGGSGDGPVSCDDCLAHPRPWNRGRAVFDYAGAGRRLVLGLKHGDRHDAAQAAGGWLHRAAGPLMRADTIVAPVPLHRWRLFRRRYNQSALLGHALARHGPQPCIPDLLIRLRPTGSQEGRSRQARFESLDGAIAVNPRRAQMVEGVHVLLIDDVMTSGATLSAATEACYRAGADAVDVAVLARVGRNDVN